MSVETHSVRQILRASAVIGGSSLFNVAVGILRNKAMAILLGPAGFGLMAVYASIADLARSLAQVGINSSGVRQIAAATASGDTARIAVTVAVLRRISWVLGLLGAGLVIASSKSLSTWTFDSVEQAGPIALLAGAVFFQIVSNAQCALIQGLRRIGDLAKISMVGGLTGTVAGVAIVSVLQERGIVLALVAAAALATLSSWWYSRRIQIPEAKAAWSELRSEARALLSLGIAFMASSLFTMGAAYLVRVIVLRDDGAEAAGWYQAAWTLGGLYVGFVLQAMSADFYPRLVATITDDGKTNQLVNEQAHVSLLLAGPGVLATLTLAPLVTTLCYSASFSPAVETLRWICLGMTLRVATWPMGFIVVARGDQRFFMLIDLAWAVVNVGAAWFLVVSFGHRGAGIAFFLSYAFHGLILYPIVRRKSGFRWSRETLAAGAIYLGSVSFVFIAFQALPASAALVVGLLATLAATLYSVRTLLQLAAPDRLPVALQRILPHLRRYEQRRT